MLVQALLIGLVVIGGNDEHGVGAGLFGVAGEFNRFVGVVGPGAGNDGNAALGLVDAPLNNAFMLGVGQSRAFAGGADGNEAMRALRDLPIDMTAEGGFINFAVFERRDQSRHRTSESAILAHDVIPLLVSLHRVE